MDKNLKKISVSQVFNSSNYVVPIYQRNYAWGETQIERLLEDIDSIVVGNNDYFLGNLIVNQTDNNFFEVIDGQQRLTTLYLLERYLGIVFPSDSLRFEAREKSNRTLARIKNDVSDDLIEELSSLEIVSGFKVIDNYFRSKNIAEEKFRAKLNRVFLIRVQVPQNIDLNHYFEIMNTRGEQLELHEIVKAKLLEVLETEQDQATAVLIWEKCSDMNSYIQMNFDISIRKKLFTENWTSLDSSITNFDSVKSHTSESVSLEDKKTLRSIIENNVLSSLTFIDNQDENERFESSITFPNFLLQVNSVLQKMTEDDASLDDKNFLNNLSWTWENSVKAKKFLFSMLKLRILFDKYILKREFAKDYKKTGKWSLQKLEKYSDKKGEKPQYLGTYGSDEDQSNKQIRTLQSCLRITYTSPKTMHWISAVLEKLFEDETKDIIQLLENYCIDKINASNFMQASGFGFERIVFTYLDYLLYRDGYSFEGKQILYKQPDDWQFQFRSSVEHFEPQNPTEGEAWVDGDRNSFGNLALITISGNSKFSNLPPIGKINSYPSVIEQSLKLKIMKKMMDLNSGRWTSEIADRHRKEMFNILTS